MVSSLWFLRKGIDKNRLVKKVRNFFERLLFSRLFASKNLKEEKSTMRNLKKILALVLALVMSLSLMATAGASSFPDVDAENPYATAIEVLDELKVFQGY